ncbi:hypothetical protein EVC30_134 [Rhizobium phage RHph_Y1_11]|nr:hypothetical protein EVC30_134 [Rhizobium phage RHph_Y1_11]
MARGGRFSELRSLSPDLQEEVDRMLNGGTNAREVAKVLQEEHKVLTDKNPDSLKKMLERYRSTDLLEKTRANIIAATKGVSTKKLSKTLNALEEINDLCVIQKARVDKMLNQENKNDSFILKQTSEEIKLLKENLVELGKLQLETGVLRRAPKTVTGQVTDADGNATNFEWTEETDALYQRLEQIDAGLLIDLQAEPS